MTHPAQNESANASAATTVTGHICPTCGHLHLAAATFEVHLGDTSVIPSENGRA